MGCDWEKGKFAEEKEEFKKIKHGIAGIDTAIHQLEKITDANTASAASLKEDLYYLDRDIQELGRDRIRMEKELDALDNDDWKQKDLRYKLNDLDGKISFKRSEQQRLNDKLERYLHEVEGAKRDRTEQEREKTDLQQQLERTYRLLEDRRERGFNECGSYKDFDMPY